MPSLLAQLHYNLGCVLQRQGKLEAAESYRQAIALNPQHQHAYNNLGSVLLHHHQFEAAIEVYQQAIAQFPGWAALSNNLGRVLVATGDLSGAIAAYQTAIHHQPDLTIAYYNLGQVWQHQGQHDKAVDCFQQAIALDPTQIAAWGDGATSLLALNRVDQAMDWLRQAIAHQPIFVNSFCQWADTLTDDDELTQAKIACARFLKALQRSELSQLNQSQPVELLAQTYLHLGNVLTAYGGTQQYQQAEMYYLTAQRLRPNHFPIYLHLGKLFEQQQQVEKAIACYRAALELRDAPEPSLPTQSNLLTEPLAEQPSDCAGLNCQPCLQSITQAFNPIQVGKGVYQVVGHVANKSLHLKADPIDVKRVLRGRVWITPQQNAWKVCRAIAVFNTERELIPAGSRAYPAYLPSCSQPDVSLSQLQLAALPPIEPIRGTVAVLSGLSGHVYFHWMVDILPRVEVLRSQGINFNDIDWFLVNSQQHPFQRETLTQLGIPAEKILESDRHPHLQADQLLVPSFPGALGWAQPWALQFLRRTFLQSSLLNGSAPTPPQRIYISRANARYRRVLNEGAVIEELRSHGFKVVNLESQSLVEQIRLFATAKAIVAPHGSGLTNIAFCQPQTQVLELVSPNYIRPYYWTMSQSLRLRHYFLQSEGFACTPLRQLMYLNPLTEDLVVNLEALRFSLEHVLI
ncbi:MAG: glycosyltransferase 61 family protein [Oculatellaceae cyanobacterium bins.114]|nr:glycosyltransferase 61 family protein [Oculatellaceae cyanobacterium bins.114]